ncbi:TPA: hypothetical protein ACGXMH_001365 [Bacillus mobilis]|uniref:hypothetical protein n=2 Tax=Bacillus mobilis TaxID=2026190 RepID=UPI0011A28082|nr:hypothetical protein [Bacillus mobilis]MED4385023.1 hypothetical protein [Bacillus mobilis]HDX9638957.1 hypothetical protein [Bacillus mobilis]
MLKEMQQWQNENGNISFVNQYFSLYETIYDLIEFQKSGKKYDAFLNTVPLVLPDFIEDSIRYRYICCVELFKKISEEIKQNFFNNSFKEMNKYFKNIFQDKFKIGKIVEIKSLRNRIAHTFDNLFTDIIELDRSEIIENINFMGLYLIAYTEFLHSKGVYKKAE